MRALLLTSLILGSMVGSLEARNLAQELVKEQYERLSPRANRMPEDEMGVAQFGPSHGGEEFEGELITRAPEDNLPSLDDYLTGLLMQEEIASDDVFLITGKETMEGQRKLKLNPEMLKKIEIPEEKQAASWWDDMIEFFEKIFS